MKIDDRLIKKAYAPYNKEALHCLGINIIVLIIITTMFAYGYSQRNFSWVWITYVVLILVYLSIEFLLYYRVWLLSKIEYKRKAYTIKKLKLYKLKSEYTLTKGYTADIFSMDIGTLYPKEMYVEKCKIICMDESGKKYRLRMVMSGDKQMKLRKAIESRGNTYLPITFGKLTKIMLWCDWTNEKLDEKTMFNLTHINYMF